MDINHNLVKGCPLCDIFLHPDTSIITKLHYPESIDLISSSDFVVVDCKTCRIPMVVVRDHVTQVSKEIWGKMLYRCKLLFGRNARLRCKPRKIFDHHHCHIVKVTR